MNISNTNGFATSNTSREKREEEQGKVRLQCEACSFTGSSVCKPKRERYAYIENTTEKIKPLLLKDVTSVSEVIRKIYDTYPHLEKDFIGIFVSDTRQRTFHRKYYTDALPSDVEFLYISLYVKKKLNSLKI